jgi:hypothetical protein
VKVSELTGELLDYWTGKANEESVRIIGDECFRLRPNGFADIPYSPHTDWSLGGPLMEKYEIACAPVWWFVDGNPPPITGWLAEQNGGLNGMRCGAPLIAICRCVVASVYGKEVPDENLG